MYRFCWWWYWMIFYSSADCAAFGFSLPPIIIAALNLILTHVNINVPYRKERNKTRKIRKRYKKDVRRKRIRYWTYRKHVSIRSANGLSWTLKCISPVWLRPLPDGRAQPTRATAPSSHRWSATIKRRIGRVITQKRRYRSGVAE